MNTRIVTESRSRVIVCCLALLTLSVSAALAQTPSRPAAQTGNVASVPSGAQMKFRGVVIERNGEAFTIRDRTRTVVANVGELPLATFSQKSWHPYAQAQYLLTDHDLLRAIDHALTHVEMNVHDDHV